MSSSSRYVEGGSSASRYQAGGASASRMVAAQGSASRIVAVGSGASRYGGLVPSTDPTLFALPANASALSNLDQALTVNGITVQPTFAYEGKNATTSAWTATVGSNLAIAGSGADPTVGQGTPLLDSTDKGVLFNNAKYYTAATTAHNVTTEDYVIEVVCKFDATAAHGVILGTFDNTTGYQVSSNLSTNYLEIYSKSANGLVRRVASPILTHGAWYHCIFFMDRSGSGVVYINGIASTAVDISGQDSITATLSNLTIGTRGNIGVLSLGTWARIALWKQASWLDTHLQSLVAQERFQKLTGLWPEVAKGTKYYYGLTGYNTRTSVAYLDKYNAVGSELYLVGAGWPRVCYRKDVAAVDVKLLLQETVATNLALQSSDLATTWAKEDAGDAISANAARFPDDRVVMDGIVADSTDGVHGVTQDITLTAAAYTASVHGLPGAKGWASAVVSTLTNVWAFFDLTNGVVGSKGAGVSAHGIIGPYLDGTYRGWMTYTGTAAAHTHHFRPAHADNDDTFSGDGAAVSVYLGGIQVELGSAQTSYIATTTAAATRAYDYLWFKADDGNWPAGGKVSVSCDVLKQVFAANAYAFGVSDAAATPAFSGYLATTGKLTADLTLTGKAITANSTAATANEKTTLVATVSDGVAAKMLENGTTETADTDADVAFPKPTNGIDRINVGRGITTTGQFNGLVGNIVIRKAYSESAP